MRSSLQWLFGGSTAVLVGSGLYWLAGDSVLAAVTGLVWGVGLALSVQSYRMHPSSTTGTAWRSSRWIGLGTGGLAAIIGVSPSLPISDELRLALGMLVIGTGLLATLTATLAEVERQEATATADDTSSTTGAIDPNR